jgi:hypothetical protein
MSPPGRGRQTPSSKSSPEAGLTCGVFRAHAGQPEHLQRHVESELHVRAPTGAHSRTEVANALALEKRSPAGGASLISAHDGDVFSTGIFGPTETYGRELWFWHDNADRNPSQNF